jgi:single-stranded-DNA-specific exonuclease
MLIEGLKRLEYRGYDSAGIAMSNGHGQGSARSIPGFHLARALEACRAHLEGCGGHEMAAGLRVETAKFEAFREAFCAQAREAITAEMLTPESV